MNGQKVAGLFAPFISPSGAQLLHPLDTSMGAGPEETINCLPGSTPINFADGVEVVYRRWYCGKLIHLVTASGKTLRATANHPIMTPQGWRPVGTLNEGDDIIEIANNSIFSVPIESDINCHITSISQIFKASFKTGTLTKQNSRIGQFHGDGTTDGNVDVVFTTRPLSFGRKNFRYRFKKFFFTMTNKTVFGSSFVKQFLLSCFRSTASNVSCMSQKFATLFTFSFHSYPISFRTSSDITTRRFNAGNNAITTNVVGISKSKNTDPTFMLSTKTTAITRIKITEFQGHVYNLQTIGGWYIANEIVLSNCRCDEELNIDFSAGLLPDRLL